MGLISSKGKSVRVSIEQLRAIEAPQSTDTWRPVQHGELVDTLTTELEVRGMNIQRAEFAVSPNGAKLFGSFDLESSVKDGILSALGFRHSNDKKFIIQMVGGGRVTVCDNLMLSGDVTFLKQKHNWSYNLRSLIQRGLDSWQAKRLSFADSIERMQNTPINDTTAQALLSKALYEGTITYQTFSSAYEHYFEKAVAAPESFQDCAPRSAWGLHNAITRALKEANPISAFNTTVDLGRVFKL